MAQKDQITLEIMGESVPALGLGTWQATGSECRDAVEHALSIGYRHIDTAQMYENEEEVGRGMAAVGFDRDELFLTTKLAPGNLDRKSVHRTTEESLKRLATNRIDLLLIHWPDGQVPLEETLEAMLALREQGKIRRIGVSNFPPSHLHRARQVCEIFCNQVEYHPFLAQDHLLRAVRDEGMLLTAYCPLARGEALKNDTLREIGDAYAKTAAQVALRWLIQQGVSAIPKASKAKHREQNFDIFDFELTDDEMSRISALGGERRIIDPEWAPKWERDEATAMHA